MGPILIGLYGAGMALAGLFRPDPGLGFPEGAPEGIPVTMSPEARSIPSHSLRLSFAL